MSFSLPGYLSRIGWTGSREPTVETLSGVLRAHMTSIPFENLDVLLGRGVRLDLDSLHAKLVVERRGGYCFEHGTLLQAALQQLGFEPVPHTARVVLLRPRSEAPQTHMFLTVHAGGSRYVLDPGFGGHAPLVPVPLEAGLEARYQGDRHRMVREGGEWFLDTWIDSVPVRLWSSTLEPAEPADFVMANHFVSTYPDSPFVARLMLRAIEPSARVSVMNREVTLRAGGREEKRTLDRRSDLRALLVEHFGFDLPEIERLRVPAVPEWI